VQNKSSVPRIFPALAGVTATLLALSLTACSSPVAPKSSGDNSSRDHALSIAIQSTVATLDPAQLSDGQPAYVWSALYDTLLIVDNSGKLQPNAAKSWKYSDDRKTLTLEIRDDMKFSNGDPVTAADVVATLERTRTSAGTQSANLASVAAVEASGDHAVVLRLKQPDATLLDALTLGAGVIGDKDALGAANMLDTVGSGPYILDKAATAANTYVLKRREDHWKAKELPFAKLTFKAIQDPTASYNALQAGELTAGVVMPQQLAAFESKKYNVTHVNATAVLSVVILDRKGEIIPELADERVRKAINMAFDREAMVKALLKGSGSPTTQVVNPKSDSFNGDMDGYYKYDKDAAKKLLADAGYADGFNVTMPSTVLSTTFEPTVTQALADIGIRVTWEPVPPQNTGSAISSKKFPMVVFIEGIGAPAKQLRNNFAPAAFINPFGYSDPELDELFTATGMAKDEAALGEINRKISAFAVEHALNAPLTYVGSVWAAEPGTKYLNEGAYGVSSYRSFGLAD
jgi:peptide/nickel transport system substrate-binding protein